MSPSLSFLAQLIRFPLDLAKIVLSTKMETLRNRKSSPTGKAQNQWFELASGISGTLQIEEIMVDRPMSRADF